MTIMLLLLKINILSSARCLLLADFTLIDLDNLHCIMATSENAQHNQQNREPASGRAQSSEGRPKAFKIMGWRNFGLFKPSFKLGLQHKNPAYEKGYN
jgi:hypothetical protein